MHLEKKILKVYLNGLKIQRALTLRVVNKKCNHQRLNLALHLTIPLQTHPNYQMLKEREVAGGNLKVGRKDGKPSLADRIDSYHDHKDKIRPQQ